MDKISVSFECPNCHTNKMVRKQPEIKAAKITCPKCGQVVKLVFDVTADPQTAVATLMNVAKEPQAPEPQAAKKKEIEKMQFMFQNIGILQTEYPNPK